MILLGNYNLGGFNEKTIFVIFSLSENTWKLFINTLLC